MAAVDTTVRVLVKRGVEPLLDYPLVGEANVLVPGFIEGQEEREQIRRALRQALAFLENMDNPDR